MGNQYLIIEKSILPECFDLVIKAKSLVENEKLSVSDACKRIGISRNTFYKYKDKIFIASKGYGRRAIVSLKTADEKGVLSGIVSEVYAFNGNVISINQAAPINGVAVITLSVDLAETEIEVGDLIERLKKIEFVKSASIVAIE